MSLKRLAILDSYPVRQKGQPRRLEPNWAGIAWLEATSLADTEIIDAIRLQDDGIEYTASRGHEQKDYSRPMFEVIPTETFSLSVALAVTPCQCDRFDRSWSCPEHREIPWNAEHQRWERPCTGSSNCGCIHCWAAACTLAVGDLSFQATFFEITTQGESVVRVRGEWIDEGA